MPDLTCICGHRQSLHNGYGKCSECQCAEYIPHLIQNTQPNLKFLPPSPEGEQKTKRFQERFQKFVEKSRETVRGQFGDSGVHGFDYGMSFVMNPLWRPEMTMHYMMEDFFMVQCPTPESLAGWLLGLKMGFRYRTAKKGGKKADVEGVAVEIIFL